MRTARIGSLGMLGVLAWMGLGTGNKGPAIETEEATGPTILYAKDEERATLSFTSGGPAARLVQGEIDLSGADLVYDLLRPGHLTVGFSRDSRAAVVDLGEMMVAPVPDSDDRTPVVPVSAFATLRLFRNRLAFDAPPDRLVYAEAADSIVRGSLGRGPVSFVPEPGHVYIVRVLPDGHRGEADLLVLLQPLEVVSGGHVALRWRRLR